MDKKYWQSFGELNNSDAFKKSGNDEFNEELPFESADQGVLNAKHPRRDFLKYLGFSTAAAAIAAGCETPVKKSIPFVNKPEEIIPGQANYYATTYVQDGDAVSILAKVRDGRPIKIEGNELSPVTGGGTSARVQASVLDLYDTARLRHPLMNGEEATFESVDKKLAHDLAGKQVVFLTSTINSPSSKEVINQFIAKYPGSRHVMYDADSYSGMLLANQNTFGRLAIPSYKFDKAATIVSINADFLGTWLSPVEFGKQYAAGKKINEKAPSMSRHFHFESVASMTGSNADERFLHRPSETAAVVAALLSVVNGGSASGIADKDLAAGITKVGKELAASRGKSLVVCGSNDVNVQTLVNAINNATGAYGTTISWAHTSNYRQGLDKNVADLIAQMNSGAVQAVFVYGANPAYTWANAEAFATAFKKVPVRVSFSEKNDETTQLCNYVVPTNNFLESWGDAEPLSGHYSFIQPVINPLFKTRQWQDSLLKWSGSAVNYESFFKTYWTGKLGGVNGWNKALQEGVSGAGVAQVKANANASDSVRAVAAPVVAALGGGAAFNAASVAAATAAAGSAPVGKDIEVLLYQKTAIGVGQGTANPWLQEMPDPVTRATWDNYIIVSPSFAKEKLGIDLWDGGEADAYEVHPEKKVAKVTANGKSLELPVLIIPGTQKNTIGIALGYGRTPAIGKAADINNDKEKKTGQGGNGFLFTTFNGTTVDFSNAKVEFATTDKKYPVALIQTHNTVDTGAHGKRVEVMKELSFATYKAHPTEVRDERAAELKPWGGLENFEKEGTIYPYHEKPGIKWGMSIDLNSCTGCGACVVACNAENNIPVVGKEEVLRGHEMHWLRIDRYYSGDMENPDVVFQPMLCQHCDNAPCENVCPVAATPHSSEGLNMMTYNRCIGTRYCANNCPYKVRRFNWADYMGADSFKNNQDEMSDVVLMMNDDLTRMVLNPDVTVRSRGVMEKCSFCVQRLQEGKLIAKRESRPLKSGQNNEWDVRAACQQSCPSDCITFGNANDATSAVSKARSENPNRLFYVLEQLHVLPNVNYLAKVRNSDRMEAQEKAAHAAKADHHGTEKAAEAAPAHH